MSEHFTKKHLAEIILWYANDCSEGECPYVSVEWCKDNIKCVDTGEDIVEHKTVYNSDVYQVDDIYFEVTFIRDNSGYWGDGESYDPEIHEVFPTQVTKTVYVHKKPD